MMTPGLLDRIRDRLSSDAKVRKEMAAIRFRRLDEQLTQQLKRQEMTPELLAKRCTL